MFESARLAPADGGLSGPADGPSAGSAPPKAQDAVFEERPPVRSRTGNGGRYGPPGADSGPGGRPRGASVPARRGNPHPRQMV